MSAPAYPFTLEINPLADRAAPFGPDEAAILNDEAYELARTTISAWPGYAPTPLVALPGIAAAIGVSSIHYKDEATRFGLGSFKALGGAYAVCRLLQRLVAERTGTEPTVADLVAGRHPGIVGDITVCCATDGNHGRSVAWGARTFGCQCVIFIHATVSDARRQAIEAFGAKVVRTPSNYDDSVRAAQETAVREGWFVVSDTSYEGYTEIPKDVMQGYELMAAEALDQWPDPEPVTHVFLQTGVGGMAAAVAACVWRRFGARRPAIVLADPLRSACWLESIRAGRPAAVAGDLDTMMAGLACGEVSILAWTILKHAADAVIAIDDDVAVDCMRLLAKGRYGDRPVVAGESAVAGLGALLAVAGDRTARASLRIDARSRILLFGTEGDTDPALYTELVGRTGDAVRGVES
jgi:diaminopropionate ammonia-lyase